MVGKHARARYGLAPTTVNSDVETLHWHADWPTHEEGYRVLAPNHEEALGMARKLSPVQGIAILVATYVLVVAIRVVAGTSMPDALSLESYGLALIGGAIGFLYLWVRERHAGRTADAEPTSDRSEHIEDGNQPPDS